MIKGTPCIIGHILDVQGSVFIADLVENEEGVAPCVTLGDEDILVGRLGSYVRIVQGDVCAVAMVSRMTEREKLTALPTTGEEAASVSEALAIRTVQLVPIGCLDDQGNFERGISVYPTTGAEVHAIAIPSWTACSGSFGKKNMISGWFRLTRKYTFTLTRLLCLDDTALFLDRRAQASRGQSQLFCRKQLR